MPLALLGLSLCIVWSSAHSPAFSPQKKKLFYRRWMIPTVNRKAFSLLSLLSCTANLVTVQIGFASSSWTRILPLTSCAIRRPTTMTSIPSTVLDLRLFIKTESQLCTQCFRTLSGVHHTSTFWFNRFREESYVPDSWSLFSGLHPDGCEITDESNLVNWLPWQLPSPGGHKFVAIDF